MSDGLHRARAGRGFPLNIITQLAVFMSMHTSGLTRDTQCCGAPWSNCSIPWQCPLFLGVFVSHTSGPSGRLPWLERGKRRQTPHSSVPRPLQDHIASDPSAHPTTTHAGGMQDKEVQLYPNHSQTSVAPALAVEEDVLWGTMENKEKLCKHHPVT